MDRAGAQVVSALPEPAACGVRPERQPVSFSRVYLQALAQLERQGYIRREPHPRDRRTTAVFPTPRGEAVYPRIMEIISSWDVSVTEPLTEEERRTLRELLKKVVAAAQAHSTEESGPPA